MKKITVILLFIFSFLQNYAETVTEQAISLSIATKKEKKDEKVKINLEVEKEKEIEGIELAMIYLENNEIDKSEVEIDKISEENRSFEYYLIKGKINKIRLNNKEALQNLKKASEINSDNIEIKILLFEIYADNSGYEKEKNEQKKEILNSNMSEEEKELFKKLNAKYEKKNKVDSMGEIYTGIEFNDNVKTEKDKEVDWATINGIMGGVIFQKGRFEKLYIAAAYKNTLYFSNSSESTHDFIITGEHIKKYKKWSLGIPTSLRYSIGNSEAIEGGYITGIKGKRKIGKNSTFVTGIDLGYRNNMQNDYKGFELSPYALLKWKSRYKINYETELKIVDEIYNKDEYKNIGLLWGLNSTRVLYSKYKIVCKYGLKYSNYSLKVEGDNRVDINSNIEIKVEIPVIREGIKSEIGYIHEKNSSNISSYEFNKNSVYIKMKKEF